MDVAFSAPLRRAIVVEGRAMKTPATASEYSAYVRALDASIEVDVLDTKAEGLFFKAVEAAGRRNADMPEDVGQCKRRVDCLVQSIRAAYDCEDASTMMRKIMPSLRQYVSELERLAHRECDLTVQFLRARDNQRASEGSKDEGHEGSGNG